MKREILCTDCEAEMKKRFPNEQPHPGEHIKFVSGELIQARANCDSCNKELTFGDMACAMSIWADHGRQSYYKWEHEYLNIK